MHKCIVTCMDDGGPGTIRRVTRPRDQRRDRLSPGHTAALLIIVDGLMVAVFIAAALLDQPAVATIAGTACVSVSLRTARHLRP